ncbi:DUF1292 domain-containing protein [Anaerococcus sp. AGMB00486]|uniref:DUF1292 domain-containing protein n=2 Tax=Anaerococcus TaxID=165779 RepID=A0ABX2N7J0_9FIRM|nr:MULTISPECIES: DUF1292 domain-containing protein [Anaerococcus]MDY3007231.1 DUF1292 domain-containing protein [Anaerococcus porci]MSS76855.1 DUF1292 domain-containing protein [Anaerococcus porci]NVF10661.1 DUF1292 domain-containing protein [Anaerococcus faecalis]
MAKELEIHGHNVEFEKNEGKAIIELHIDDNPIEAYLLDIFSVDEIDYIALIDSQSSELYLLEYKLEDEESGEITLNPLEDEDKLDEIYHLFNHYWDEDSIDRIINEYIEDIEDRDMDE